MVREIFHVRRFPKGYPDLPTVRKAAPLTKRSCELRRPSYANPLILSLLTPWSKRLHPFPSISFAGLAPLLEDSLMIKIPRNSLIPAATHNPWDDPGWRVRG